MNANLRHRIVVKVRNKFQQFKGMSPRFNEEYNTQQSTKRQ